MHATHRFFMSKRSVYVIVLDGRKEQNPDYWLHHARAFGGNSPILIVINKIDQHQQDLERNTLMEKYPRIQGFFPLSCKDNSGIDEFIIQLQDALQAAEAWESSLPTRWYEVKTQLQEENKDCITVEKYHEVCREKTIESPEIRRDLLGHLHDLGVMIHFEDLSHLNTYVLNPQWLTNGVYQVLNSKALKAKKGIIAFKDLAEIFNTAENAERFPEDKYRFIMETMQKFELAYFLNQDPSLEQALRFLIPDLLEPDEPGDLNFDKSGALIRFRFEFPFLPTAVMARFIVRMAEDIDGGLRWRSGVVLRNVTFDSRALVRADNDQRNIRIWVRGTQQRGYFAMIRDHFLKIFSSFENFDYEEQVPLTEDDTILESYQHLLGLETMGETVYVSGKLQQTFDLKKLMDGLESEERRRQARPPQSPERWPSTPLSSQTNTKPLFISYSHHDKPWLDRLLPHLGALKYRDIDFWYDQDLRAGDNWNNEIEHHVRHCQAALCLVSPHFLDSTFIREREIPAFQERGISLLPILVEPCAWSIVPWLSEVQLVNKTALSECDSKNHIGVFNDLLTRIAALFE